MTTDARTVVAGLEGRVAGWRIVAGKEFSDHISSARFVVLLLVLGAAAIVPLYFASDAIRSVASQVTDTRNAFLALFLFSPSSVPIPNVFNFVGIVAPLLGVAFAFDAINSERTDGTLPRLLSQPIYRDDVVNGKFTAGLAAISLVLLVVVGVISGFGIVRLGIVPSPDEVIRLLAWVALTILWVSLWLAFGLLLSVVIRRAATAALVGFGVWLLVAIFGQLIISLVAGVLAPVASAATAEEFAVTVRAVGDDCATSPPYPLPGSFGGPAQPDGDDSVHADDRRTVAAVAAAGAGPAPVLRPERAARLAAPGVARGADRGLLCRRVHHVHAPGSPGLADGP